MTGHGVATPQIATAAPAVGAPAVGATTPIRPLPSRPPKERRARVPTRHGADDMRTGPDLRIATLHDAAGRDVSHDRPRPSGMPPRITARTGGDASALGDITRMRAPGGTARPGQTGSGTIPEAMRAAEEATVTAHDHAPDRSSARSGTPAFLGKVRAHERRPRHRVQRTADIA